MRRATGDRPASSSGAGAGFLSGLPPPPSSGTHQPQSHLRPLAPPGPSLQPSSATQVCTQLTLLLCSLCRICTRAMKGLLWSLPLAVQASTSAAGSGAGSAPSQQPGADFLGLHGDGEVAAVTAKLSESAPFGGRTATTATKQDSWATFE